MSKIAQLREAAEKAKAALDADPNNAELKAASDAAAKALSEAEEAEKGNAAAKGKGVEVRVLLDHLGHKAGDVVTIPADQVDGAKDWADAAPAAVAFAKKELKAKARADD